MVANDAKRHVRSEELRYGFGLNGLPIWLERNKEKDGAQ